MPFLEQRQRPTIGRAVTAAAIAQRFETEHGRADVPVASAISEYVDVAKAFFDDRQAKFVNGVLDAVAKDVR